MWILYYLLKSKLEARDEECNQLKSSHDETKRSLIDLAAKYQELLVQIDDLQASLNESKVKYTEKMSQTDFDKQQLEGRVNELIENEKSLITQVRVNTISHSHSIKFRTHFEKSKI